MGDTFGLSFEYYLLTARPSNAHPPTTTHIHARARTLSFTQFKGKSCAVEFDECDIPPAYVLPVQPECR